MILSRAKPAIGPSSVVPVPEGNKKSLPKLEDFLKKRDYVGAITLLEFQRNSGKADDKLDEWVGYCAFHLGDYKRALSEFENLTKNIKDPKNENWLNLACCYFFLGMYPEAEEAAEKAPKNPLRTRLFFHLAHKFNDETRLMMHHQQLEDGIFGTECVRSTLLL
ncbi:Intraflagellar transport protein 56 [Armadillidium vulgare]|nr:Intraflagellar transport protein 56 [Armadillidium vulgare]